jgi:zinc ribbon protein
VNPANVNAGIPVAFVVLIVIWVGLGVASFGVWLWGLIDAARRPDWAYTASASSKTLWIVLIAVLGAIPAIIYLVAIRPRVRATEGALAQYSPATHDSTQGLPPRFCTRCGARLPADARFCWRCGGAT